MNKICTTLLISIVCVSGLYAQRQAGDPKIIDRNLPDILSVQGTRDSDDTLSPSILEGCPETIMLLLSNESGYVAGGNNYGDLEKAQFINTETSGDVYSVLAFIGGKVGGSNEIFSATLMDGDVIDGPGNVFALSNGVNYTSIDTTGMYTTFEFDTPVPYDNSFFISLEVTQGAALIGILHTDDGCGGGSAWELWDTGDWYKMDESWGDMDIVMLLFAEVEGSTVGLDNTNLIERGSEKVFPNPANESANLIYSLLEPSDIQVRIYTTTGVLVDTYNPGIQTTGLNQISLDTQGLGSGLYIYSIETDNGLRTGRFSIVK